MSAKDTLHDVGITGITTFSTGIAFDILSRHWSGSSGGRLKSQAAAKLPKVQERVPGELPEGHRIRRRMHTRVVVRQYRIQIMIIYIKVVSIMPEKIKLCLENMMAEVLQAI